MRSGADQEQACNDFCHTRHSQERKGRGGDPDVRKRYQHTKAARENQQTHIEHRELVQNSAELFVEGVLGELDLAHVKFSNATYLKVFVDDLFSG